MPTSSTLASCRSAARGVPPARSEEQADNFDLPDISGNNVVLRAGNVFGTANIQTTSANGPGSFTNIADGSAYDTFTVSNPKVDGSTVVFRASNHTDTTDGIYTSSGTALVTTPSADSIGQPRFILDIVEIGRRQSAENNPGHGSNT